MTIGLDYTFWIQIVNFLLLIFILNIVLYKPVMGILEKRKGQIEGTEQEIRDLNLTIEQKEARYEEKLRLAKTMPWNRRRRSSDRAPMRPKAFLTLRVQKFPRWLSSLKRKYRRKSMKQDVSCVSSRKI